MTIAATPRLAAWVTQRGGQRHLCTLVGPVWFALCGSILLDTEDGPRIPERCGPCIDLSLTEGLVLVPAEERLRIRHDP